MREGKGKTMTIAMVSRRYGLSQDTLRYYERVGMIPPVHRTQSGLRDYTEEDCRWVELAKCMRGAGLPVEKMVAYVKLCRQGDETFPQRLQLLEEQRKDLLQQRARMDEMLTRLDEKIKRYEAAVRTGHLPDGCCEA